MVNVAPLSGTDPGVACRYSVPDGDAGAWVVATTAPEVTSPAGGELVRAQVPTVVGTPVHSPLPTWVHGTVQAVRVRVVAPALEIVTE
jgi:hypothetical protein